MCSGSPIDLRNASDPTEKALSAGFLQTILSDTKFTNHLPKRALHVIGAEIDAELYYIDVNEITLQDCNIRELSLITPTIRGIVFIENSKFERVRISSGRIGRITLRGTEGGSFELNQVDLEARGLLTLSRFKDFRIVGSHLHSDLYAHATQFDTVNISQSIVDGSIWLDTGDIAGTELEVRDSKVGWTIALGGPNPPNFRRIGISNTSAVRVTLAPPSSAVQISGSTFSEWPNDLNITKEVLAVNSDPRLFEQITRAYKNSGQYSDADAVQYLRKNFDFAHAKGFARFFLYLTWLTVGYGLYPAFGFVWFGILIVIGYFVFRSGSGSSRSVSRPRSWLFYSLDTIIPVIKLDPEHEKVAFEGWRQYYLYAMRVLSTVLVFLIAKILGDIIAGY